MTYAINAQPSKLTTGKVEATIKKLANSKSQQIRKSGRLARRNQLSKTTQQH